MPDRVDCAECGAAFDSDEHPFCPRCGSLRAGAPVAVGQDPARRRVQMAGLVLILLGLAAAVPMAFSLAAPPDVDPATLEALAGSGLSPAGNGGTLVVNVTEDGHAVPAHVAFTFWNGSAAAAHDVDGRHRMQAPASFLNATIVHDNTSWLRHLYVPPGNTVHLDLDVAAADPAPSWVSADLSLFLVVGAAVGLAGGAAVMAGGVAAMRLRAFPLAVTGAALALAGSLILALQVHVLFLNALLAAVAVGLVVRGRRAFKRPA